MDGSTAYTASTGRAGKLSPSVVGFSPRPTIECAHILVNTSIRFPMGPECGTPTRGRGMAYSLVRREVVSAAIYASSEVVDGIFSSSLLNLTWDGCCASTFVEPFFAILLSFFLTSILQCLLEDGCT